jgi:acetyl-CoA C-acetyltransferase
MREVAFVGAGMTTFGEHADLGLADLARFAVSECLLSVDKGASRKDIGAAWLSQCESQDMDPVSVFADSCGLLDLPVTLLSNTSVSGHDAIRNAALAVASGHVDVALVVGVDKSRLFPDNATVWHWLQLSRKMAWHYPLNLLHPMHFAIHLNRYLADSSARREHLALIVEKNRHHGQSNPRAQLCFPLTAQEVLDAPVVAEPLGLYDCAPPSDGAAAVLLTAGDLADRYTRSPVWLRGIGVGIDRCRLEDRPNLTTFAATVRAAKQAYQMAGIGPSDVDVGELHDLFSGVELITYEDLGFAERFGAHALIEAGRVAVGGSIPVNPSGGLTARGHPRGASGIAQCVEIFEQLRGDADNQVEGAQVGLAHSLGGPSSVSTVAILGTTV